MNKILVFFLLVLALSAYSQSFAPAPGYPGSTAIHKDSSVVLNWANGISVTRGFLNSANPSAGLASFGDVLNGIGPAEGDGVSVVSLGDGGVATLTFPFPISDSPGPDFAVFENGFTDNYMELAHVEVSSNGIDFFRFPSVSETPLIPQQTNFSFSDCRYVHNLAGKYRQGFGTPFDLAELPVHANLNIQAVTHVRLIDVVGSVDPNYGTTDAAGNWINDAYPTEFASGGFDLDAVAVLHENTTQVTALQPLLKLFPNPSHGLVNLEFGIPGDVAIFSPTGIIVFSERIESAQTIDLRHLQSGVYFLQADFGYFSQTEKILFIK